jgi:hypothetical protein
VHRQFGDFLALGHDAHEITTGHDGDAGLRGGGTQGDRARRFRGPPR